MQTLSEIQLWQRYFKAVRKGLIEDPFDCICGYELNLLPKRKNEDYIAFFVCHMCQREYRPGSEHRRIALSALEELEN